MAERPILFSAPMVRALLAGNKTQTRRVVKVPKRFTGFSSPACALVDFDCPYGRAGDRLWVRETWCIGYQTGEGDYSAIPWNGADQQRDGRVFYRASVSDDPEGAQRPWKPSIHMPRWASRILLDVTSVRVERLQDITAHDARAEGIQTPAPQPTAPEFNHNCIVAFRHLWESINGARSWDENPFVWVVEFAVTKGGDK